MFFQGGLRVRLTAVPRVRPFVEVLGGMARSSFAPFKQNNAVMTVGAGVDVPLNEGLNIRAQFDFPTVLYDGGSEPVRRLFVGISFRIGGQ
jgi:hypothetical protein